MWKRLCISKLQCFLAIRARILRGLAEKKLGRAEKKQRRRPARGFFFVAMSLGEDLGYLTTLQRHSSGVKANPGQWLPWNYNQTITPPSTG